ncbi:hypothetical protein ACFCXR_01570 [Streptomyces noursei]|uniref:hypothetical protein n=1 Tax=Streptomyces noursei TaxID=1971 RepID=UPI0035DF8C39
MTAPPRPVEAAHRLRGVRTAYNDHIAELFPRHQRLVSYVIRPPGADVSAVQSQLRTLAEGHGRYVGYDITDEAACSLRRRDGYAEALDLVHRGRAHGLVVPNQATISETSRRTQERSIGSASATHCSTSLIPRRPNETSD